MDPDVMEILMSRTLSAAETDCWFDPQPSALHRIVCHEDKESVYTTRPLSHAALLDAVADESLNFSIVSDKEDSRDLCRRLVCLFQSTRPKHTSGQADKLPFADAATVRGIFTQLNLPRMYVQIADGTPGLSSSTTHRDKTRQAVKFDLSAHYVSTQGNWSIALAHLAATGTTSTFWSIDQRMDAASLLEDLASMKDYASHPMLIPSIMLSSLLRMGVNRRKAIKTRLKALESAIHRISVQSSKPSSDLATANEAFADFSQSIEGLFELLNASRKEQISQEGRYYFWKAFRDVMQAGFAYVDELLQVEDSPSLQTAHVNLRQWSSLNWHKIESLQARDMDYVSRVNNISDMLFHLVNQRDSRVQLAIAQASQHDSEDMKFIALLGSIFLPASLVASIFGVQEFQFAPGAALFGAYVGISIPLIGIVVALCLARRYMTPLWSRKKRVLSSLN